MKQSASSSANSKLGRAALAIGSIGLALFAITGCGGGDSDSPAPSEPAATLSCAALADTPSESLVGNRNVVPGSVTSEIVPAQAATAARPATPAYCHIRLVYSSLSGPQDGYDQGQSQLIRIRLFLPLSAKDGGTGSLAGNWNGRQMVATAGGNSGTENSWSSFAEGLTGNDMTYGIRLGYIASSTDVGLNNTPTTLITSGPLAGTYARGTIEDWQSRGTHTGKMMAALVAKTYYGSSPTKVYLNGCSGGGSQALGQLQRYGGEYDGALIAAPAIYRNERFQGFQGYPTLVWKKVLQKGGTIPTAAQVNAVNAAAVAACDVQGPDTAADGIISDPRACKFSAKSNICGTAGAPSTNCLTPAQADAIDKIWDGPRNRFGDRTFFGWDRGTGFPRSATLDSGTVEQQRWNHKSATWDGSLVFQDAESMSLAGNPLGGILYDDEAALGSNTVGQLMATRDAPAAAFVAKGGKIIHFHGTADNLISWQQSVDYYRRMATQFGNGTANFTALQSWYRFFPVPGGGHCGGGGAWPVDPFLVLLDWAENGKAPDAVAGRRDASGNSPAITRKICPFPSVAVYNGTGNINDAASYSCGGNLETQPVQCDSVRTRFKSENRRNLDFAGKGIDPASCPGLTPGTP
jgi:hypothetical protein